MQSNKIYPLSNLECRAVSCLNTNHLFIYLNISFSCNLDINKTTATTKSVSTALPTVSTSENSPTHGGVHTSTSSATPAAAAAAAKPLDDAFLRKFRNLVSTCPRPGLTWSELNRSPGKNEQVEATRRLVKDFLKLVSGKKYIQCTVYRVFVIYPKLLKLHAVVQFKN